MRKMSMHVSGLPDFEMVAKKEHQTIEIPADAIMGLKQKKILIIEDEDTVRRLVKRILVRGGYEVHEASSSKEAMSRIVNLDRMPDLIISDYLLPDGSGLEIARELKKNNLEQKIIIMSGITDEMLKQEKPEMKNMDFINKPFNMKSLLSKVEEVLARE